MSSNILKKFDEFFNNPEGLTMPKIESFVHESLKFLDYLKEKMENGTEEEKEKAMSAAQELQKKMMEQAEKSLKASGLNRNDLEKFINQPENFSHEEWEVLSKAKAEMSDYQNDLLKSGASVPQKKENPPQKPGKMGKSGRIYG